MTNLHHHLLLSLTLYSSSKTSSMPPLQAVWLQSLHYYGTPDVVISSSMLTLMQWLFCGHVWRRINPSQPSIQCHPRVAELPHYEECLLLQARRDDTTRCCQAHKTVRLTLLLVLPAYLHSPHRVLVLSICSLGFSAVGQYLAGDFGARVASLMTLLALNSPVVAKHLK